MRIVFLSYSDFKGGASIAAFSIFKAIKKKNIFFLTANKKFKYSIQIYSLINKFYIFILRILEKIIISLFNKKQFHQSLNIFDSFVSKKIEKFKPDIINLHWINRSMISLKEIDKLRSKIVLSLHDMWYFSSTEHYFIRENNDTVISKYCWSQKKKILYKKNVFLIVHNKWMLEEITKRHPKLKKKIFLSNNYPINTNVFKPRNKTLLRKKYNLPLKKKIIFFSAQDISDKRKGFEYFMTIVKKLSNNKDLFFLSLGGSNINTEIYENYKHISFISNKKSSELYSLSDIFLCTSIIDNLPLTVLEAVSSGNMVISFKNGGATEVLKDIGYTFTLRDINKLVTFIEKLSNFEIKKKSIKARQFALKNFNINNSRIQYQKIFNKIYSLKI